MNVVAVGVSYKTAPLEVREQAAWTACELPGALVRLRGWPGVREAAILSTCNRTELYAVVADVAVPRDTLLSFWSEDRSLPLPDLARHAYFLAGPAVAAHLGRVAGGLDAMVLGETQILGQVKEAYQTAQASGTVGKVLHSLYAGALNCAKRIHTETGVSQNAVSVSYAAVELARKIFGSLEGRSALLVGAGETAELTARHLVDAGVRRLWVANRTLERGQDLARVYGGQALPFAEVEQALAVVDVVVTSTGAPHVVLRREVVQRGLRARRGRPLFILDLAVPRDVDPAVGRLDNVFLYDIDDLEAVVAANLQERAREAEKAERIVAETAAEFAAWLRQQEAVPLIRQLRERAEAIRRSELERAFRRLPGLSQHEREVIGAMTAVIVNKLLNDPTVRLKELANGEEAQLFLRAFTSLFNLSEAAEGEGTDGWSARGAPAGEGEAQGAEFQVGMRVAEAGGGS
ncbi:MAG: glutamyl-tRNA reductase [Clostridia bacterium]|nr:glutamyl-tRNA reductase [Clostridia bacterium]